MAVIIGLQVQEDRAGPGLDKLDWIGLVCSEPEEVVRWGLRKLRLAGIPRSVDRDTRGVLERLDEDQLRHILGRLGIGVQAGSNAGWCHLFHMAMHEPEKRVTRILREMQVVD